MNKKFINFSVLILLFLLLKNLSASELPKYFSYIDPAPGAMSVNKETAIIIRPSGIVKRSSVFNNRSITVTGNFSGIHKGKFINPDDNSSVIFKPDTPFKAGETISVTLNSTIKTTKEKSIEPFTYSFFVKSTEIISDPVKIFNDEINAGSNGLFSNPSILRNGVTDFPAITITNSENPSPGNLFLTNIVTGGNTHSYLMIFRNSGEPVFSREMTKQSYDFKQQPNGNYTYYDQDFKKFFEMDTSYNIIDSFYCGNGYSTDLHELRLLNNGHALLMSYDQELLDSSYGGSGGTNGQSLIQVIGLIVQEIDQNKNVVFQWRSWDHFKVTDATHENLAGNNIDYVHGNAIEIDNDNNLLISSRHMDEITKINRTTGEIIWRLGGKNNQFTFINDPSGFSHQHAIRRIKNGNITLFDNGNFHTPNYSRAIEYKLDEINKTATLIWQYRNIPDIYGLAMGYVQRLDNGNTLISWGLANPTLSEVTPDGTKVYELSLPPGVYSYRTFRYLPGKENEIPAKYSLGQNYPNPFNPVTKISFDLPEASHVKLIIYDVLGREIETLVNSEYSSGHFEVTWNGSNYSSGVYFYKLQGDRYTNTKKLVLIK